MTPIEIMARAIVNRNQFEDAWPHIPEWSRGSHMRVVEHAVAALQAGGYMIVPAARDEAGELPERYLG